MAHFCKNGPTIEKRSKRAMVLILVVMLWAACPVAAQTSGQPVAKVNAAVLTEADLRAALNEIMPAGVFHGGFSSAKRQKYRSQALEKAIEKELFYQEALKKGLHVSDEMIKSHRSRTIKRLGGEKKFKAALRRAGLSDKQYQARLRKKYLIRRLIKEDISDKAVVSDAELKTYYEAHKSKFMRPEARRVTHILIAVKPSAAPAQRAARRRRAQEVIDKIKAGQDMSALAWEYSDGPYRVKGGDMGLVHRGRLDPELEKAVFALKPGKLSGIIKTIYGYHIVRVGKIKPPTQLTLAQVSDKLRQERRRKKEKQIRRALVARLKRNAQIVTY